MIPEFPGASPMKTTPDDSRKIDDPMTRALFSTYADGEAGGVADDAERTLESETRHAPTDTDSVLSGVVNPVPGQDQGQGSDLGLHTARSSGSAMTPSSGTASRRGIVGKIQPGQTLYSKYLVLRRLGAGAMGEVWLVRHAILKSEHALKVIVPNFATNGIALMRFQREFEVMASLRHEHAVIIYDACIDADGGYIDMEYVEGPTIHEVLGKARGRDGLDPSAPLMPLDWIVRVLDQLCEVLQVAHQKGIVHRDLKPSNMMFLGGRSTGKEYLKVLDFGIAKIRDDPEGVAGRDQEAAENKTQGFIGTPAYGSPEQALGLAIDGRSDLYSVGIMLYEVVTGRLPFRGNHWQVMNQNANTPPPPFAESNTRLRPMPEVEQAILRVLAKDPDQRPQTARQLYQEFRRAVEAVLTTGGSMLPPSTWDASSFENQHAPPAGPPSTERGGFIGEPPSTEAATWVGKAGSPSWKGKFAVDRPSDLGRLDEEGAAKPRWSLAARFRSRAWAISITLTIGCASLLLMMILGPNRMKQRPGRSDSAIKPVDFERYWPSNYRPVEGYTRGMPWPEKVRRTTDQAVFLRFADGIYLPEAFELDSKAGLAVDGWPKVIVKDGIRFLRMPGGTWIMGAWDDPNAVDRADAPAHPVTLTGFYIQETEVTLGQFEDYLKRVDESPPKDWEKTFNTLKRRVGPDDARRYPASNVSRQRAQDFARELGGQLPTEAQWEYAARSLGKRRRFVWGDFPVPSRELARIDAIDGTPAPVGSYPRAEGDQGRDRTEEGVLDLTGNVQELCRDAWVSSYRKSDAAVLDPCTLPDDPDQAQYTIRGGSYASSGNDCATTRRDKIAAADLFENLGFRLVVECPDARKSR